MQIVWNRLISITDADIKDGEFIVPNGVTAIGKGVFRGRKELRHIVLPEGILSIGNIAFRECTGLFDITFPSSLVTIGDGAFCDCSRLTEISFAKGLASIGAWAFRDCTELSEITLPNTLRFIGNEAFHGCNELENITLNSLDGEITHQCKCIDQILTFIQGYRVYNAGTKVYKAQSFHGMRHKALVLDDCIVVEKNGLYAHGKTIKAAMDDLRFKHSNERGADQYRHIDIDEQIPLDEILSMYRVITGACRLGVEQFVLLLGTKRKRTYSPREVIERTQGHYGHDMFEWFWNNA
ncbi:MAG: leucine-rich repeat domain-containing protein [Oscillospiraceae bacterium]|nr:leucine-rich repeat domain-containing protein [Oscillospiraceae bacterium]